ncbi:hypothetical protein DPMN_104948 [Dreissena polymorpha]|uniref:Uncharacterized protein n=1 Tax=Dreissena polymorpha TaxID=45954 RepID=A0A9D4K363_DREPO|nr:hypothetical protein DPMN_104948 [Dreissena polymorpha]
MSRPTIDDMSASERVQILAMCNLRVLIVPTTAPNIRALAKGIYSLYSDRQQRTVTIKPDTYDGTNGFEQYL